MRFFLIYGTVEGQTRKITEHVAERLRAQGHDIVCVDASAMPRDTEHLPDLSEADAVVVAACVHQKVHQEEAVDFVLAHRSTLETKPGAFISVSLAAATGEGGEAEAREYIERFVADTGWTPTATLAAPGALRYNEYDFFKQQIVKFVVMQKGLDVAPGKDHEFTDWDAVNRFVDGFAAQAQAGVAAI